MLTKPEYIQLKAYARLHGTIMGLLWIAGFACFVGSISEPVLSFFFNFTIIFIPFLAASFVRYYRDRVLGGMLSFRRAYCYSLLIFFYATLLLAIAQWAYFEFLDQGRMLGSMTRMISTPEFAPVLEAYKVSKEEVLCTAEHPLRDTPDRLCIHIHVDEHLFRCNPQLVHRTFHQKKCGKNRQTVTQPLP